MTKNQNKKLVLLDAHAILHRAYHALPDFSSAKGEPTGALYGTILMITSIIEDLKPDYMVACYDLPDTTFRKEIYEDYKAGRKEADEELVHQIIRSKDIMKAFDIPVYEKSGFEADDILGTIVEQTKNEKMDVVIASGDMDTLQLVDNKKVQVYMPKKGIKTTVLYDEKAVIERMGFESDLIPDYKGLSGDASDNIKGIAGIGDKTATNLIQKFGTIEQIYKKLESKKGEEKFVKEGIKPRIISLLKEGKDDALFSKELATIRRDVPIEFNLPKGNWQENADFEKINLLLRDLGFRSLVQKLKDIFGTTPALRRPVWGEKEVQKVAVALWVANSNMTNPSQEDVLNYTNTDELEVAKKKIWSEIKEKKLEKVLTEIEIPLISVVKKMNENGVRVDTEYLKGLSVKYHKELDKLRTEIWKIAGEEFNINSPKQVGEVLFEKMGIVLKNHKKTSTGAKSTNIAVLEKLQPDYPIVDKILKYREFQKLLSTYIDNIPKMVGDDGRLHTTFLQAGTVTGRMASQDPNLQNIPIKTDLGRAIRGAFIAEKGFKLVACDYSQIELRLAALLSGDEKMIRTFREGKDIHNAVASEVFDVSFSEVDSEMRRRAKIINFGILYGMGVNSLRKALGEDTKRVEAQEFYNNYFERFPGLAEYIDGVKADTKQLGYTETFFGRRRYFEGINSKVPFVRAMAERMAINAPIQGTSADMIKIAMTRIDEFTERQGLSVDVKMLLQVHDELIFEIREDLVEKIAPEIEKIMEEMISLEEAEGIKFEVDVKVGDSWNTLEKI